MAISLRSQILEVEREIAMRRRVYKHQVDTRKMKQEESDMLIGRMEAVRDTLVWLEKNEAVIKAKVEAAS